MSFAAADVFDFSCIMQATNDSRVTVKLCQADDDDNAAIYVNNIQLKANEMQVVKIEDCQFPSDASSVKLIFDLGGCAAGTKFQIGSVTMIKK